jgi:intracellular sulfur oxidation DsrE/DsrF family protein
MKIRQLLVCAALSIAAAATWAQDKVVYHFDDAQTQALRGLRAIRNHLDVDPTAQISAVAHAEGIDFLLERAKSANGTEYAPLISALRSRGVKFEVCEITIRARNLKKDQFIEEADFTPSGVVRIAKLQQAGAAYIKP